MLKSGIESDFVTVDILALEGTDDAVASVAVAVRVDGMAHALVGGGVVEQGGDFVDDEVVVGAHKMDGAALEGLGALGGVAHHQHRLAQAGGLFLDATRVGEDNGALLHQIDELEVLQRLDEEEVGARKVVAKHFVDGLAHVGIQVHWINKVNIRILLGEVFHSRYHADEAVTEVFAAVAGDEHQLALLQLRVES